MEYTTKEHKCKNIGNHNIKLEFDTWYLDYNAAIVYYCPFCGKKLEVTNGTRD